MKKRTLRPIIDGKAKYERIPIMRKIMGTGASDTQRLIDAGVPGEMRDIGVNPETGVYSMDCSKAGNIPVYSTTRLLQLIPKQFTMNGVIHMPMIGFGEMNEFGLSKNECFIFNTSTLEPVFTFSGHTVSVLVRLTEYIYKNADRNE